MVRNDRLLWSQNRKLTLLKITVSSQHCCSNHSHQLRFLTVFPPVVWSKFDCCRQLRGGDIEHAHAHYVVCCSDNGEVVAQRERVLIKEELSYRKQIAAHTIR